MSIVEYRVYILYVALALISIQKYTIIIRRPSEVFCANYRFFFFLSVIIGVGRLFVLEQLAPKECTIGANQTKNKGLIKYNISLDQGSTTCGSLACKSRLLTIRISIETCKLYIYLCDSLIIEGFLNVRLNTVYNNSTNLFVTR